MKFGPEYLESLRRANTNGSHIIPTRSPREAKNLRTYYYHFRRKLKLDGHPFAPKAKSLIFQVRGSRLLIRRPDTNHIKNSLRTKAKLLQ